MAEFQRIFASNEHPVLSFEVQARMSTGEPPQRSTFAVLVRHFLSRFLENDVVSLGGDTLSRMVQVLSALAVPGIVVALYLIPAYDGFPPNPLERPYWAKVSDHYFYITYAFVLTGAVTVLEWDLLFPDLLDVLVLTPLPLAARKLFSAKLSALAIFLGLFLLGTSVFGALLLPAIAKAPSLVRHIFAHFSAVAAAGMFAALLFVALQGLLLSVFGDRLFRRLSPLLQALSLTLLLIILFLFPLLSHFLPDLLASNYPAVRWFPPFWFLGIYETLLDGHSAPAAFHTLAGAGDLTLPALAMVAVITYPLAYRRRVLRVIEGSATRHARRRFRDAWHAVLHATYLRQPALRGVYHFISQTLMRGARNRVYLSMYAGLGLALVVASCLGFRLAHGRLSLVFSTYGLLSTIPIAAFWLVSGLRVALRATIDAPAGWIFRIIGRQPNPGYIAATRRWVLLRALLITLGAVAVSAWLKPAAFARPQALLLQVLVSVSLALLLTDAFFLREFDVPFTVQRSHKRASLAVILLLYLGVFPPYVWSIVDHESWIGRHLPWVAVFVLCAHIVLLDAQRRTLQQRSMLIEVEDEDEFPQRLGLR